MHRLFLPCISIWFAILPNDVLQVQTSFQEKRTVLSFQGFFLAMVFPYSRISVSMITAPTMYPLFVRSRSWLVSVVMLLSSNLMGFQRKYFLFSWSVIWIDRQGALSLLPVGIAVENMKQMGGSNLIPLPWFTSCYLILWGISMAIFPYISCYSIYIDVPVCYSSVYAKLLSLHSYMNSNNKKLLLSQLLTIVPIWVLFVMPWNKLASQCGSMF